MKRNIELKARYPDLRQAHHVARDLGAALHGVQRQRDTYFRSRSGRLKLRQVWLGELDGSHVVPSVDARRPADRAELIWYRRPDEPRPRASDYHVAAVESAEALRTALCGALGVTAEVVKQRAVYVYENVRIHIDQVVGLGAFLEFEAIVDATCDERAARAKIQRLRAAFGITCEQIVPVSYADLAGAG